MLDDEPLGVTEEAEHPVSATATAAMSKDILTVWEVTMLPSDHLLGVERQFRGEFGTRPLSFPTVDRPP